MIYNHNVKDIYGSPIDLASYKGKVLLIVNVASKCGLTPQYEGLEKLFKSYSERGFTVLGFPCNQFLSQEPGTPEEIVEFCKTTYDVTFPLTEKVEVNGDNAHPIFQQLKTIPDLDGKNGDIAWNFEKFLVNKDGTKVIRFRPQTEPLSDEIISNIETFLSD